ncbi:MAG: hypothetical protein AMJ66_04680 [Betaproteobacteria bacterium SG8_40]|nr:MAG: hypothetical protein AMJ66_04680 [Betaproteobacteria bacterium SG8_40]
MAFAELFSGIAGRLFGPAAPPDADQALVADAIEAIVDAVDPRIRAERRYASKLEAGVRRTIEHMRAIGQRLPPPVDLSPASWQSEALVRCCFARPDDVRELLGRSRELYRFFAANPGCDEAHALLGMRREERTVLATALVGDALRQDVQQVTVSFDRRRLIAPAADALGCRREVGAAILRRMAALALQGMIGKERRVKDLEERKGILATRLRMLHLRRDGVQRALEEEAEDPAAEIAQLERALQATVDEFIAEKASLKTLEGIIDGVRRIFEAPQKVLGLETLEMRLSGTGVRVEVGSREAATDLRLQELFIGDDLRGVIAFVRCARQDMPPPDDAIRRAARTLI